MGQKELYKSNNEILIQIIKNDRIVDLILKLKKLPKFRKMGSVDYWIRPILAWIINLHVYSRPKQMEDFMNGHKILTPWFMQSARD